MPSVLTFTLSSRPPGHWLRRILIASSLILAWPVLASARPRTIKAFASSETRIDLSWPDNAPGETGFEVHGSPTGRVGTFALLATTGANAVAYSDTGLDPSTSYCYKVRSFVARRRRTTWSCRQPCSAMCTLQCDATAVQSFGTYR